LDLPEFGAFEFERVFHFGDLLVGAILGARGGDAGLMPELFGLFEQTSFFLLRKRLGSAGTLAAVAFLALSPSLVYYSRFLREDIYMALFVLLMVAAMWRYLADGPLPSEWEGSLDRAELHHDALLRGHSNRDELAHDPEALAAGRVLAGDGDEAIGGGGGGKAAAGGERDGGETMLELTVQRETLPKELRRREELRRRGAGHLNRQDRSLGLRSSYRMRPGDIGRTPPPATLLDDEWGDPVATGTTGPRKS
ncbi:MAG: hypothetical protein HC829_01995, partial [Bacteroidales bacterium]|nr:hypothetical protein [Bacteroidales bacterium]